MGIDSFIIHGVSFISHGVKRLGFGKCEATTAKQLVLPSFFKDTGFICHQAI